jgi:quercetin dioxygenase-like cupin family protein
VLFTSPECRAVVIDLRAGEALGDHNVRERVVVHVVDGEVSVEARDETASCGAGTLLAFEPGERHSVRAASDARLLLLLAPWPAPGHYSDREAGHAQHLPANAVAPPTGSADPQET